MRGVKFDELSAIVDFLYRGEANVVQDNLESFLAIAEELQLRGLMGRTDERVEDTNAEGNLHSKLLPAANSGTKLPDSKTETFYFIYFIGEFTANMLQLLLCSHWLSARLLSGARSCPSSPLLCSFGSWSLVKEGVGRPSLWCCCRWN